MKAWNKSQGKTSIVQEVHNSSGLYSLDLKLVPNCVVKIFDYNSKIYIQFGLYTENHSRVTVLPCSKGFVTDVLKKFLQRREVRFWFRALAGFLVLFFLVKTLYSHSVCLQIESMKLIMGIIKTEWKAGTSAEGLVYWSQYFDLQHISQDQYYNGFLNLNFENNVTWVVND